MLFTFRLVFTDGEHTTIGTVFEGVCYALAGLGGVSYIGSRFGGSKRKQTTQEDDEDVDRWRY